MKNIFLFVVLLSLWTINATAAPHWVNKPIQCGTINDLDALIYDMQEEFLLRGVGTIYNQDREPGLGIIGVYGNTDTGTFTIIEVFAGGTEACVIAFGNKLKFDLEDYILEIPEPESHPRGIDKMNINEKKI